MNIFVGNLSFKTKENDLKKVFKGFGNVISVAIAMDKKGKKSRGFAFVEMPGPRQAQDAITALDGQEFMGRVLNVSPALSESEIKLENKVQKYSEKGKAQRGSWSSKPFSKTSGYKQGRRSRSFMARRAASGIEEPIMPQKNK